MKLRSILLLLTLSFGVTQFSYAQKKTQPVIIKASIDNPDLIGSWQYKTFINQAGESIPFKGYTLKVYGKDRSFQTITLTEKGFIMTHSGTFKSIAKDRIKEIIGDGNDVLNAHLVDQNAGIQYQLSEDKKTLTIRFNVKENQPPGTFEFTEVWTRILPFNK